MWTGKFQLCRRGIGGLLPCSAGTTIPALVTGTVKAEERQRLWQQSHMRIFFATPQTFWNDVKKGGSHSQIGVFSLLPLATLTRINRSLHTLSPPPVHPPLCPTHAAVQERGAAPS